ncbi:hypothetical protein OBBRIDRAFT_726238, partial [Obba rivulosa]
LLYCLNFCLIHKARAALVNIIVNDQYGDPVNGNLIKYEPSEGWRSTYDEPSCNIYNGSTERNAAYMGTWHVVQTRSLGKIG